MKNTGTVVIETERLILRPFVLEDSKNMFLNWANDPEVTKYLSWKAHESIEVTESIIKLWLNKYQDKDFYQWVIAIKNTNEIIGTFSVVDSVEEIKAKEIGYCIGKIFWNKGYVTEAGEAVINHLFNVVDCNRIWAVFNTLNPASGRVMEKLRMSYEGILRQADLNNEFQPIDVAMYSILKKEF